MKKRKVSFTIQILHFKMTLLPMETCSVAVALIREFTVTISGFICHGITIIFLLSFGEFCCNICILNPSSKIQTYKINIDLSYKALLLLPNCL